MKEITEEFCNSCNRNTNHTILSSHKEYYVNDAVKWSDFQTIKCNGCNNVSFREVDYYDSDTQGYNLYPPRNKIKQNMPIFFIPIDIQRLYREVCISLNNNLSTLSVIGIRMLIEVIHNDIVNKRLITSCDDNIAMKINNLYKNKIICKSDRYILDKIRKAGNKSAHEGREFNISHIITALSIIENIIKSIYIYPKETKSQKWLNTSKLEI